MFNAQKDQLFLLIKSLTKAEKRNFKVYANRFQASADTKFIQLFDVLDRLSDYDEEVVLKRLPEVEKKHLGNLKRHLYKQILTSLRLIHIQKNIDIQIREQLDFARILYGKGMYMQSLKLLDRIKQIALEHHQDTLHLEVIEFQKLIEARHITRSRAVENKMEELLYQSEQRSEVTFYNNILSNLNIKIHGWYIQHGHVKNEGDRESVTRYLNAHRLPDLDRRQLTFFEKVNLYQSWMWYHYIQLDFHSAREQAGQWVNLFSEFPQMKEKDPDLYMRGLYYLMTMLFLTRSQEEFRYYLDDFKRFLSDYEELMNNNSRMIGFFYFHLSRLNYHLMSGSYAEGIRLIDAIRDGLVEFEGLADVHRVLLFEYKFAWLHFGCRQYEKALDHLNEILLTRSGFLREDLVNNARILQGICHYELGHLDLLGYLVTSLQRSFAKSAEVTLTQRVTLNFLRRISALPPKEAHPEFLAFRKRLKNLENDPYESKALLYLNIPLWVESHLQGLSISEITTSKNDELVFR